MKSTTIKKWVSLYIASFFTILVLGSGSLLSSCSAPSTQNEEQGTKAHAPIEDKPKRYNSISALNKPYVLLVSLDGFRYDYIEKYNAKNLAAFEKNGRRAKGLIPSFPTKTFPNHYTIVTGMLPTTHGLVDNDFYDSQTLKKYSMGDSVAVRDGSWYGGEPLWMVAERSGMIAASYFWVGSEAEIKGYRPSYYYDYDDKHDNKMRVAQVLKWLSLPESERPHMLTLYFSIVDSAGHKYGPDAPETGVAVQEADQLIGELRAELASTHLPINFIVVSDHGMGNLDPVKTIYLDKVIDLKKYEIAGGGAFLSLYSNSPKDIQNDYNKLKVIPHAKVFFRNKIPAHYKLKSSSRLGDLVMVADNGYYIMTKSPKDVSKPSGQMATHGWDNINKDMHGVFLAEGVNIKPGPVLAPFENIHIYPFILKILGLHTDEVIDGKLEILDPIYRAN